jgi:hypothetical protein
VQADEEFSVIAGLWLQLRMTPFFGHRLSISVEVSGVTVPPAISPRARMT